MTMSQNIMEKPNSSHPFHPKWQRGPGLCLRFFQTRLPNAGHRPPPQDTARGKTMARLRKEAISLPLIKVLTLSFEDGLNWVRGEKEGGVGWRYASNPSFEIPTAAPLDLRRCKREEKSGLIDPPVALVTLYPSQIEVVEGGGESLCTAGGAITVRHHYTLKSLRVFNS